MGVTSLWEIVGPAARPVKLEALTRKKLAVDASIWIYQFLKAVRDKEGNTLHQSHIVGFFRRICKLLYYGILPLFVFDGGAPALKRKVIQQRKDRRQENQVDAALTAQKLLAIQLQKGKRGEKASQTPKQTASRAVDKSENMIYLEDMPILHPEHGEPHNISPQLVKSTESSPRKFVKKDEYHLPDIHQFKISKNDSRIMPATEFQEYADDADFDTIDGINIDTVDPSSKEFGDLPLATQYMMLSHLRLRSRLRLGYSKDQLEGLFPNSKDFSRFQIEQVKKRNYYTQKLMTVSGMSEDSGNITRRIAGDRDRHYTLMKNDDGWTLSLEGGEGDLVELDENGDVVRSLMSSGKHHSEKTREGKEDVMLSNAIDDSSNSDDELEDVEPKNDDMEANKAMIESIYDMYQDDYRGNVDGDNHNEAKLKKAVEGSKKLYFELQKEEQEALKLRNNAAPHEVEDDQFDFKRSLLFDETQRSDENDTSQFDDGARNDPKQHDEVPEASHRPQRSVPSWFDDSVSQINKPHSGDTFLKRTDETTRLLNDDEEAGLISWSEAKEMIEGGDFRSASSNAVNINVTDGLESGKSVTVDDHNDDVEDVPDDRDKSAEDDIIEIEDTELKSGFLSKSYHENADVDASSSALTDARNEKAVDNMEDDKIMGLDSATTSGVDSSSRQKVATFDYEIEADEEEDLIKQLREENHQHEEFATEMKKKHEIPISTSSRISDEQLYQERVQKAKRDSDEVSQTMIQDVQELLKRFGIPFITAPMEAEAQCAELFRLGMVDGIITDDSDCFLFGGSRIYKNMFNQKQYVECYFSEDVDHKIGLNRERLIELALLLGSDYTEGIKGIGPVLAMEILAEFGNLKNFKHWFDKHARDLSTKDSLPSKLEKNLLTRIKNGKLFLPESFPDHVVFQAYTHPEVDKDESEFKWGVPNLDQIRSFLMFNVGWTQSRVDEVMLPLIRDMNRKRAEGSQSTVGEFFPQEYISYKKEVSLGKRMKVAANRLHKNRQ